MCTRPVQPAAPNQRQSRLAIAYERRGRSRRCRRSRLRDGALALARRGVEVELLEAEPEPGLAASGTNSGILHTGFDSIPGELETELILRAAELRGPVLDALGVPADPLRRR